MSYPSRTNVIVLGFIATVMATSIVILVASQYQRAERAEAHAADVEKKLDETKGTDEVLAYNEEALATMQSDLGATARSHDQIAVENVEFAKRDHACRYLVRATSEVLGTAVSYGKVANQLMNDRKGHAADLLPNVSKHLDATDQLVKDAGYSSISELMDACTPASSSAVQ